MNSLFILTLSRRLEPRYVGPPSILRILLSLFLVITQQPIRALWLSTDGHWWETITHINACQSPHNYPDDQLVSLMGGTGLLTGVEGSLGVGSGVWAWARVSAGHVGKCGFLFFNGSFWSNVDRMLTESGVVWAWNHAGRVVFFWRAFCGFPLRWGWQTGGAKNVFIAPVGFRWAEYTQGSSLNIDDVFLPSSIVT